MGFQSTRPARGATVVQLSIRRVLSVSIHAPRAGRDRFRRRGRRTPDVSIHAPRAGRDACVYFACGRLQGFNPRAPRGARLARDCHRRNRRKGFQSTRPARGATISPQGCSTQPRCFNPRAPRGARPCAHLTYLQRHGFQSTRPARGATLAEAKALHEIAMFQSTRPARGATGLCPRWRSPNVCFNPRAPRGARPASAVSVMPALAFQSTRPARGATRPLSEAARSLIVSIHAPRAGRDRTEALSMNSLFVSIHAPRAGRDRPLLRQFTCLLAFQSTRPARGATSTSSAARGRHLCFNPRAPRGARRYDLVMPMGDPEVSIHAPRAGRDRRDHLRGICLRWFQSTRPARDPHRQALDAVSIHAPRAGRDRFSSRPESFPPEFQSTRPARGATLDSP